MQRVRFIGEWVLVSLFVVVAGLSSGCSTWLSGNFEQPDIQLVDAELLHARLLEQKFQLYFRIDNPNSSSLPIRSMRYKVHLNDIPLGQGVSRQWLVIPAENHAYFDLPAHTNIWRHIRTLVRLIQKPEQPIRYSLEAEIKTGLLFNKKVKVSRSGHINLGEFLNE